MTINKIDNVIENIEEAIEKISNTEGNVHDGDNILLDIFQLTVSVANLYYEKDISTIQTQINELKNEYNNLSINTGFNETYTIGIYDEKITINFNGCSIEELSLNVSTIEDAEKTCEDIMNVINKIIIERLTINCQEKN